MINLYKCITEIKRSNCLYSGGEWKDDSYATEEWATETSNGHYSLRKYTQLKMVDGILGNFKYLKSTIYLLKNNEETEESYIEYTEDDFIRLRKSTYIDTYADDISIIGDENPLLYKLIIKNTSYDMGHQESTSTEIKYDHDFNRISEIIAKIMLNDLFEPGRITTVGLEFYIYKINLKEGTKELMYEKKFTNQMIKEMKKDNKQWIYPKK